jgi:hypothetical protein|tara:strand:- start:758 stop:940 length:183 start_codon:yes stop_codon:yes gene_type:complete
MSIIQKSIYLESDLEKKLSWCEMPGEFGISITTGGASLCKKEAAILIKELTQFVNNQENK